MQTFTLGPKKVQKTVHMYAHRIVDTDTPFIAQSENLEQKHRPCTENMSVQSYAVTIDTG
ncbi:hypothetical protein N7533_009282 [Penicillium manginii]|uniref:uncharacterized protein n=1 Tax=Penicillium manginii TaxID=203109 RepID=UPI002548F86C|nr:uncharacterized protein N7533_009282 [Penicillium manginii]KAJ5744412.1 hypothetical protein N7533_009282 [Penicillium manginii]